MPYLMKENIPKPFYTTPVTAPARNYAAALQNPSPHQTIGKAVARG